MKQQTAVMSLLIELYGDSWSTNSRFQDFANKYLEMEKKQIMQSYNDGKSAIVNIEQNQSLEQYYNKTYGR